MWWALPAAPKSRPSPSKPPTSSQGEGEGTQETHGPARRGSTCPSPLPAGHGEPAWRAIHPGPCPSGPPALPGTRSPRGVPGAALGAEALVFLRRLSGPTCPHHPLGSPGSHTRSQPPSLPRFGEQCRGQSAPAGHRRAATAGRNHRSKADPRLMQLPVSGGGGLPRPGGLAVWLTHVRSPGSDQVSAGRSRDAEWRLQARRPRLPPEPSSGGPADMLPKPRAGARGICPLWNPCWRRPIARAAPTHLQCFLRPLWPGRESGSSLARTCYAPTLSRALPGRGVQRAPSPCPAPASPPHSRLTR